LLSFLRNKFSTKLIFVKVIMDYSLKVYSKIGLGGLLRPIMRLMDVIWCGLNGKGIKPSICSLLKNERKRKKMLNSLFFQLRAVLRKSRRKARKK